MKLNFMFALLIGLFFVAFVFAQEPKIDLDAFIEDTQKTGKAKDDTLTLVWWIPTEFWTVALQDEKSMSQAQKDEVIGLIRPYTLVLVVDGKIGDLGKTVYRSDQAIRQTVKIIDGQRREWKPLPDNEIGTGMKTVVKLIEPMLVNMLGSFGSNMHIVAFTGTLPGGSQLVDPRREGTFTVSLEPGRDFIWRLPLASLVPRKHCPIDGERFPGNWKYCPFHGTELKP